MTATLIKNGRIVTAVDDYVADILVNTGRVHTIGRDLSVGPDVEVHDAGDSWCSQAALMFTRILIGSSALRAPSLPEPKPQPSAGPPL
jgi:hypothetical protein